MSILDLSSKIDIYVTFIGFWLIALMSIKVLKERQKKRLSIEWLIDVFGLLNQGVFVPLVSTIFLFPVYSHFFPGFVGSISINSIFVFLIPLTLVDYIYYWNHRLLHKKFFWPVHQLHHSAIDLDILVTSRNSVVTPFYIVYLWIHPLFLIGLQNPQSYMIGVAISSVLDLWRHSGLKTAKHFKIINSFLITPEEHELHHTEEQLFVNFGANLNFWDRIHGTYLMSSTSNNLNSVETIKKEKDLLKMFLNPWGKIS